MPCYRALLYAQDPQDPRGYATGRVSSSSGVCARELPAFQYVIPRMRSRQCRQNFCGVANPVWSMAEPSGGVRAPEVCVCVRASGVCVRALVSVRQDGAPAAVGATAAVGRLRGQTGH